MVKEQKHINLSDPIPAGLAQKGVVEISGTSPADVKSYQVTISIDKVNGQPNAQEGTTSATFQNVSKAVARRTVVEEYTGTGCGWCPRGWVGMEKLKRDYPETFIGIAFHKYNTSDPMYVANYYSTQALGISGAPGCNMNRRMEMDPYYGTYNGIWNDFEAFNAELPAVDVSLTATWNSDKTAVDIKTSVEPRRRILLSRLPIGNTIETILLVQRVHESKLATMHRTIRKVSSPTTQSWQSLQRRFERTVFGCAHLSMM